jgi:hypothetical protein
MKKRAPAFSLETRLAIRDKIQYKLKSIIDEYAVINPTEASDLRRILELRSFDNDVMWDDRELFKIKISSSDEFKDFLGNKLEFGEGIRLTRLESKYDSAIELTIDISVFDTQLKRTYKKLIVSPYIVQPEDDENNILVPFQITSMSYETVNHTEPHVSTDWQIATDKYFKNIVFESLADTNNLTTITVTTTLEYETTYYVRCRHRSASYDSQWGLTTKFMTGLVGIAKPSIVSPISNDNEVELSDYIDSSAYTQSGISEPHVSTDWQIATDINFTSIVYESLEDTDHLTSIGSLAALGLATDTTYYVRCRYHSASYVSKWSEITNFSTINIGIGLPYIVSPSNGATEVQGNANITSSSYNQINQSEPHISTDWQIATDSSFNNIVVNKVESTTELTSIGDMDSLGLNRGVMYHVRCRYHSTTYVSDWSIESNFTLAVQSIDAPSIITPLNNATDVDSNSFINSTAYSPVNHTEPHTSTDWQIATDNNFTNLIHDQTHSSDELISIGTIRQLGLSENTPYYVRCRYNSASFTSGWSSAVFFTTEVTFTIDEVAILIPSNVASGDKFGNFINMTSDGKKLVIGAAYGGSSNQGSVYLFKWNGITHVYEEVVELTSAGVSGDQIGYACDISDDGNTIIASSPWKNNSKGTDAGSVFVFRWNTTTEQYEKTQELLDPNGVANDRMGWWTSISNDGNIIIAGVPYKDAHATDSGAVIVWKWNTTTEQYDYLQTLNDTNVSSTGFAGECCTISGDGSIIMSGAQGDDIAGVSEVGSVGLWKWNTTTEQYDFLQHIEADDGAVYRRFGYNNTISDDGTYIAVVGAFENSNTGKVYILKWNTTTEQYDHVQHLTAPTPQTNSLFGLRTVLSGDNSTLVVGSNSYDSTNGTDAGAIFVYKLNTSTGLFDFKTEKITSNGNASDYFGSHTSISEDGSVIAGCSSDYDNGGVTDTGAMYIFK